ncbi:MAG: radical SAM protein, partial [Endomicrobia bacterium]|nr:radical SAM protein [Endomicrobiia bacterium]
MLIDKYGRKITYLRVSVTERCNFNCTYCSSTDPTESVNEVSLEYYLRIIKVLSHLGINRIRLTGGEPFLRTDFVEFISEIKKLNIDVAITTNASLLSESIITKLDKLNIKRFNVSLDTLNKNRFYEITKTRLLNRVIENIKILSSYDINLKLNCVIMKSINSDEVEEFIEFA